MNMSDNKTTIINYHRSDQCYPLKELRLSYDEMISLLDGAAGRLIVPSMSDHAVREALDMITKVSISLGELGA